MLLTARNYMSFVSFVLLVYKCGQNVDAAYFSVIWCHVLDVVVSVVVVGSEVFVVSATVVVTSLVVVSSVV